MTSSTTDAVRLLSRALDQAGDVMAQVKEDQLPSPTPCTSWDVAALIGHMLADARNFLLMLHGERADFSAAPEPVREGWTATFRAAADDLLHAAHQQVGADSSLDLATAEFAVHTWDLARAIGAPVADLDTDVAERGLTFMRANLTADGRGSAFAAEREPSGDGSYERLVAFAGRA